jgi:hypothetical protein
MRGWSPTHGGVASSLRRHQKNSPHYGAEAVPLQFRLAQTVFGFIRLHLHAEHSRIYAEHVEVALAKPAYFGRLSINFSKAGLATLRKLYFISNFKVFYQK